MYVRAQRDNTNLIDGKLPQFAGKANLYPTAFPFDRCQQGGPGAIAYVALHGRNPAVTTLADIWDQGGVHTLPTAAFTFGVSSSSASDTAAGTGAQTVEVDIIDANYKAYTFVVALNGQTKVVDTNLVLGSWRINDVRVKSWGSGLSNAGDIYVYDQTDTATAGVPQTATKIFAKVLAGANLSRGAFYTVPAGCKMQGQQFRGGFNDIVTTARAATMNIKIQANTPSGLVPISFPIVGQLTNTGGPYAEVAPDSAVIFDEKTDVVLQAVASAAGVMIAFLDCVLYFK